MGGYRLWRGLAVGVVVLWLAGCRPATVRVTPAPAQPVPVHTATATTPSQLQAPTAVVPTPRTSTPTRAATATLPVKPIQTSTPTSPPPATTTAVRATAPAVPGLVDQIFLGVPAGDSYVPTDVAIDPAQGLAYVYHARSAQGGPVIAVVDLAADQVTRQIALPGFSPTGSGGRLLLAPDGRQAYVTEQDTRTLGVIDLASGAILDRLSGVRDAALSPDGETLYVIDEGTARAFETDQRLTPRWQVEFTSGSQLIANADRVLISRSGSTQELVLLDGASGRTLASQPLPDTSQALARGPDGGWAVRTGSLRPQVQRFTADLRPLVSATSTDWGAFYYDAPRQRYILTGYRSPQPDLPASPVIVTLAASDLVTQTEVVWPGALAPDLFVSYGEDQLLGLTRYSSAQLLTLDPATFAPSARAALGVQLTGAALDLMTGTLFVADNQERIHVLDWPGGTVRATWPGAAPLVLDAADQRLYVNRAGGVVALDGSSGEVLAEFDRPGFPAPDGARDRVYVANAGVTRYDRSGHTVGRLAQTFPTPQGFSPNPRAVAAYVNPHNGYLLVEMNNGVPGSNNSDFIQVYAPGRDDPIAVPPLYNFVHDVVFDPRDGTTYVSYAGKGSEAIQRLSATGEETGRLLGRTGLLVLDSASSSLRAHVSGTLARVDATSLELRGVDETQVRADQLLLDEPRRWLVVRDERSATLSVLALDDLAPQAMQPQPVPALPERPLSDLQVTADDRGTLLYTRIDNQLFRSRDGQSWEQMPAGSAESFGHLTVAGRGTLFYTNLAEGGSDGVLRSRDGGDTWEFLTPGLHDLRLMQPVVAQGADTAYAVDRSGHLLVWRPANQRWEVILAAPNPYTPLGTLTAAPDGTLLLLSYERYRRSTDGGQTWADVPLPGPGGQIVGFATDDGATPTVYAFFGIDTPYLARSPDGGLTWERLAAQPAIQPYAPNFEFAAVGQTLYLYTSDYAGNARLVRSLDAGVSWQEADSAQLQGSYQLAVAPDGYLWFGFSGQVRAIDPAVLRWTAAD